VFLDGKCWRPKTYEKESIRIGVPAEFPMNKERNNCFPPEAHCSSILELAEPIVKRENIIKI
jgi:hypothetical protein